MAFSIKRSLVLCITIVIACLCNGAFAADGIGDVKIDADTISFSQGDGVAAADGNVRISNGQMRLFAPHVEYDSSSHVIDAEADSRGSVTFITPSGRLSGQKLRYDVMDRHGIFTHPSGKIDRFYVKGESLEVLPLSEVPNVRKRKGTVIGEDDMSAEWSGASITTCDRPDPHYRFEASSLIIHEGVSAIIKSPKVYLGSKPIFSYPFDYYIPLARTERRHRQAIFPKIGYESQKGAGLGLTAGYGWTSGFVDVGLIGWTEGMIESEISITQDIGESSYVYAELDRLYDKDSDVTQWRPTVSVRTELSGWTADLTWSQRQLMTLEKRAGVDSRYVVWKRPEFSVISPWMDDVASGGRFRVMASWGEYEDAIYRPGELYRRYGFGAQLKGESNDRRQKFKPFYNAVYWFNRYADDASSTQQILDAALGVRWSLGKFDLETAYLRRWRWGSSPMRWDLYDDRQEIYQGATIVLPTKDKEINWQLGVRAAYDIDDKKISEMVYKVGYDMHCMLWEAVYRDDRIGSDQWFGLNLTVKAFPDSTARLGTAEMFDPAAAPDKLVPITSVRR